jgi:hypothetical protein
LALRVSLLVLAGVALAPRPAGAAACCVSSSVGLPRLRIWEDAAGGLTGAYSWAPGYWDQDATWRGFEGYGEREWRLSAWGLARVHKRVQLYALVPFVINDREGATRQEPDAGLGDVAAAVRYELANVGELGHWPGIALSLGVTAPTGRAIEDSASQLAADTTGRGAWVIAPALVLEQVWGGRFLQATLGGTIPLPRERSDNHQTSRFGPGVQLGLAAGFEAVPGKLVLAGMIRASYETSLSMDGRTVPNSGRADTGVGVSVAWDVGERWTVTAGVDVGLLFSGLGDNQPGRVAGSLGLRYAYF